MKYVHKMGIKNPFSFQSSSDGYTKLIETFTLHRALQSGTILHAQLIINGLAGLSHFASKLITLYTNCRQLPTARKLFDKIPDRNIRRWLSLIGALARNGYHRETMGVFCEMQCEGLRPNIFILPSILKACGHLSDRQTGVKIHAVVLKHEFESDPFVSSSLIDMYSKCGEIGNARRVFDTMLVKDLVALNAIVSGYVQQGFVKEALGLVEEMQLTGLKLNVVTWNTLIAGFSKANDELMVTELFKLMSNSGLQPDVVSWTSVISSFVQNFRNRKAFNTFQEMLGLGIQPTSATISSLLPACANQADLKRGREIHGYAVVCKFEEDIFVRSALIDMYSKCGCINEAKCLFEKMPERNTVTWNSMIFGYANHGYCNEAIQLFDRMMAEDDRKLDHLTFTAALTACCHAGMIELGQGLYQLMQEKYLIKPRLEHYACMVDLFGRAGEVDKAYDLIKKMPVEADLYVWGALLGACRQHGNVELAQIAAERLAKLETDSGASSVLLANLYADAGSWNRAAGVKRMMKKNKSRKLPGSSWFEPG